MKFKAGLLLSLLSWEVFAGHGSETAKVGGTFYENLGAEAVTLNPLTSQDVYATVVHSYVMETLCKRDPETYEDQPALAKSYNIAKDNKSFEFELREGVKWHDGKPLTVQDVKFSYDAIFDSKYATAHQRPYYENIDKVEISGPNKIKFTVKNTYFKNFTQICSEMKIIPKHIYENPKDMKKLNRELIGTGPYKIEKYEKGTKLVLKRNSDWWGWSEPSKKGENNFDKIVMRFVQDDNVSLEMLKKGDLDFEALSSEDYMKKTIGADWDKIVTKVKVENKTPKGYGFIGWNLKNPMFQDKNTRKALQHLFNRDLINQKFHFGLSLPATGPWYQQSEYASLKVKPMMFDLKLANEYLKKAGWSDSDQDSILDKVINGQKINLSFTLITADSNSMKYLTIYKEDAKKAGVDINLKIVEWNSFMKMIDERNFEALALAWSADVEVDPKQIFHSESINGGGSNFISYSNPEVDKLIDEARLTFEKKQRIPKMQKIYELIADDAPYAFMFNSRYTFYAHRKHIKKMKDSFNYSVGRGYWWIEK